MSVRDQMVQKLRDFAGTERSPVYRAASVLVAAVILAVVVPAILVFLSGRAVMAWPRLVPDLAVIVPAAVGVVLLVWALVVHVRTGHGTPAPNAPPVELVVSGPYRFCRNPMQLGWCLVYLSMGTYFRNIETGIVAFVVAAAIGTAYHKFVEEKVLLERFGAAYEMYREKTPFWIPRIIK